MMKHYVKLACFVGGALFGSAGVKLLASKDAKKAPIPTLPPPACG